MNLLISDALAQSGGDAGSSLIGILPMILIFVVFYFLLIRPQQKRTKEHKSMVAGLEKGDEIVTSGGTLGKILKVDDSFITVEISQGVEIQVQRMAVAQMMPKGTVKF
ncbi:MAG: preprotein translocase subunit YajC [Gammaproteobacteria bacterium]|nr:preprotein translocase subunit YajC [Gammaproteobacteria bacterium]